MIWITINTHSKEESIYIKDSAILSFTTVIITSGKKDKYTSITINTQNQILVLDAVALKHILDVEYNGRSVPDGDQPIDYLIDILKTIISQP